MREMTTFSAQSLFLALGAFVQVTRCKFLSPQLKHLGTQYQIPRVPTPKEYLTLQNKGLGLHITIWGILQQLFAKNEHTI